MMKILFTVLLFFSFQLSFSQSTYFPPITGNAWDTISPLQLGWCPDKIDSLIQFLEDENTKAFLVLKDGKIVIEHYYDNFTANSLWYWASAGKSLTAFLTGLAQEQNYLSISDTTSTYLGTGWTSCTPAQEEKITILNQLTMTSGLDDGYSNSDCTDDTCLFYLADAGTRWAYHNAPYTLTEQVISNATGVTYNQWTNNTIEAQTGMSGLWIKLDFNNVYWSKPRDMARFGLLMLNNGVWNNDTVMHNQIYFNQMINTSQPLNESYGYLWWLNGKPSYMLPSLQFVFNGSATPNAPNDMYSALGKNGQILNIVPSENLIVVRMGNNPNNSLVPVIFLNDMWAKLNDVFCFTSTGNDFNVNSISVYPNPVTDYLQIDVKDPNQKFTVMIFDASGRMIKTFYNVNRIDTKLLKDGIYFLKLQRQDIVSYHKFIKQ